MHGLELAAIDGVQEKAQHVALPAPLAKKGCAPDWIYSHGELEIPPGALHLLNRPTRDTDFETDSGSGGSDVLTCAGVLTRSAARIAAFDFIEAWDNPWRRHSSLGQI